MKILFLEDNKLRQRAVERQAKAFGFALTLAKNISEFREHLDQDFDIICFDHDLEEERGTEAVDYLVNYSKSVFCVIHSHNPDGAKNIESKLKGIGFEKILVYPFGDNFNWLNKVVSERAKICKRVITFSGSLVCIRGGCTGQVEHPELLWCSSRCKKIERDNIVEQDKIILGLL